MGDRVNVKLIYPDQPLPIFFYSHWGGHRMAETIRQALLRKERWDDDAYLGRIIFCEMLRRSNDEATIIPLEALGDVMGDETGFGIAPYECDPENPTITIDIANQLVSFKDYEWTFEKYTKLTAKEVSELHVGYFDGD